MATVIEKRQERGRLVGRMRTLVDAAKTAKRDLSADELAEFDTLDEAQARLAAEIEREDAGSHRAGRDGLDALEARMSRPTSDAIKPMPSDGSRVARRDGEVRILSPRESLREHLHVNLPDGLRVADLSLGRVIRAIATGTWRGAEAEQRVMGESVLGAGGALMPDALSVNVIDLARNRAVVMKAGARTVEMPTAEFAFAREAGDPTAAWKGENAAATESDVALERVTLRARTLMALTRSSLELMQDAPNAPDVIERSLAAALALELDRAGLRGGQTAGSIEPVGVRFYSGVQLVSNVGAVSLDDFSNAAGLILAANGPDPSVLAAILTPREWSTIDRMKDGDGLPLRGPASWEAMAKFATNQLPATLGVGGNESEAIVGPFAQMIVGVRSQLQIEVSRQASDAFGKYQVLVRAVLRGDVVLEHEDHFVALTGITPSS
jgi:HK97 family phage major capsid protein